MLDYDKRTMKQINDEKAGLTAEKTELAVTLLTMMKKERGITVEELAQDTGISYSMIANMAAMLEADGFISVDLLQRCFIMVEKFR